VSRHFKGIFRTTQSRLRSEGPNIAGPNGREGVGFLERGSEPPAHQLGGLGSAVSSLSWVWGGAPVEIDFGAFYPK